MIALRVKIKQGKVKYKCQMEKDKEKEDKVLDTFWQLILNAWTCSKSSPVCFIFIKLANPANSTFVVLSTVLGLASLFES